MKKMLDTFNKFFGAVIAINILHQIVSSAGYLILDQPILKMLYFISIAIFGIELFLRIFLI